MSCITNKIDKKKLNTTSVLPVMLLCESLLKHFNPIALSLSLAVVEFSFV